MLRTNTFFYSLVTSCAKEMGGWEGSPKCNCNLYFIDTGGWGGFGVNKRRSIYDIKGRSHMGLMDQDGYYAKKCFLFFSLQLWTLNKPI